MCTFANKSQSDKSNAIDKNVPVRDTSPLLHGGENGFIYESGSELRLTQNSAQGITHFANIPNVSGAITNSNGDLERMQIENREL